MRVTMKVEVEVTVETEFPQSFTAEALAADVREYAQERLMTDYGNVVVMTITPTKE